MNVNSNANNNVVRQRRETEKKSESDSRMLGTEHNGKKDNNKKGENRDTWRQHDQKHQRGRRGGEGGRISKKLHNANVYASHFLRSKVRYMKDHLKLTLRENQIILFFMLEQMIWILTSHQI